MNITDIMLNERSQTVHFVWNLKTGNNKRQLRGVFEGPLLNAIKLSIDWEEAQGNLSAVLTLFHNLLKPAQVLGAEGNGKFCRF